MKHGALQSVKFKKLKMKLGLAQWQAVGLMESVWMFTARNAPMGDIGRHSNEDIAVQIEWSDDPDKLISVLIECGWIDRCETHRLVIHDWHEHLPNWLAANLKSHGKQPIGQRTKQAATTVAMPVAQQAAQQLALHPASSPLPSSPSLSSPSSSQSAQQPVRSSTGEPATWAEVAEAMKSLKISRREQTMKAAQRNGFNPAQVLAIIDYLVALPAETCESPAGALCDRLGTVDAADWDCNENWPWSAAADKPESSSLYDVPSDIQQENAKRLEAESLERSRKFAADVERRELRFGEALNAMSFAAHMVLIGTAPPANRELLTRDYQAKGRDSPDVRPELLRLLESVEQKKELAVAS